MKNAHPRACRLIAIFLALTLGALACRSEPPFGIQPASMFATPAPIQAHTGAQPAAKGDDPFRMDIQLSEGKYIPQPFATLPPALGDSLTEAEIDQILRRLTALEPATVSQAEFRLPADPLPPPRPAQTITQAFPPDESANRPGPVDPSGPLQVLRFAPEGEVPLAPFISVTFNQDMVPLATLTSLAEKDAPAIIQPSIPGTWRWLGARTLTFEHDSDQIDRLPKATQYRVTIPAGTKSLSGGELAEEVTWFFSTPPPVVLAAYPADTPQPLEPLFFLLFDQRINPPAVLERIQVYAGNTRADLRLATKEEAAAMREQDILPQHEGRWIAFKATRPFPPETRITVTVGPGVPSAEGPLPTSAAYAYSFSTYAPLRVESHGCNGWDDDDCPPFTPFYIHFNNPLNLESFSENMLTVLPEIPGVTANVFGNTIQIQGETRGQTNYTVTISGRLKDEFGQELGRDTSLTFRVGPAAALLLGPSQHFVSLDPAAATPSLPVYALNYASLDVSIYAVEPSDWPAFKAYIENWRRNTPPAMPGQLLSAQSMRLNLPSDTLTQVNIDLSPYTRNRFGQFVVVVSPPRPLIELDEARWQRENQTVILWAQVTNIGLDAYFDHQNMLAWATDLQTGAPLAGVHIRPQSGSASVTDANGLARFPIPDGAFYLTASKGGDTAILPSATWWGSDGWRSWQPTDTLRWFFFDDRAMYRPGEQVHLKGWVRRIGAGPQGDVGLASEASSLFYQVYDATGNPLGEGQAEINALGGFDFVFKIPEVVNLGMAQIRLSLPEVAKNAQHFHTFQIQQFRRPEFEVIAKNETSGPYFIGAHAVLSAEAKYYAGGALPNAEVNWMVTTSPASYSPPHWPDFTFGEWRPWWPRHHFLEFPDGSASETEFFSGQTDTGGFHYLRLDFTPEGDLATDPQPLSVLAEASVIDVNRQAWVSSTALLVHPAQAYIGLRTARYFTQKGAPMKVDFIVTDLDGKPMAGQPVEMEAARMEWKYRGGQWQEEPVERQQCAAQSTGEAQTCEFHTAIGGAYRITARVRDERGRFNQSRITRWVSGAAIRPLRKVEHEVVTLIPDKQTYQPGDIAEVLVQSPFGPAQGLLTVTREGILFTESFRTDEGGAAILRIPITEAHTPNLNLQVDLTGSAPRLDDQGSPLPGLPPRPAYAVGALTLDIPPLARALRLQVTPLESRLEPGGATSLVVLLTDAAGNPVADAEVAVVVVDEAILSLTSYQMSDPLSLFYAHRGANLSSLYARDSILLIDPLSLAQKASEQAALERSGAGFARIEEPAAAPADPAATMMASEEGMGGGSDLAAAPIRIRADFNPLALFAPSVRTAADGSARVQVNLPDNLTRYRVMAVAVDTTGKRFGQAESNLTARLPLMVRPSAPRFLNFGDTFELPIVLQNQTDEEMVVNVAARASNLQFAPSHPHSQAWGDQRGVKVTVPANDRVEVRFPASTIRAGEAVIQVAAVSGAYADAATIFLPVYTPATAEAFATYGVIDGDGGALAQPVQHPAGVFPQYGGLEITTSSTALHALTDAALYLTTHPFEGSEQLASRILAVAALREVLGLFKAEGLPEPAEIEAAMARDIEILRGMQNADGGFPSWQRGFESVPFNSIHVAHALVRASEKGYNLPEGLLQSSLNYLRDIENRYPHWYHQNTRHTLSAYALFTRNLAGERDTQKAERLLREAGVENLSLDAIGWLWPLVENETRLQEIRRHIGNRVIETPGAANFSIAYDEQTYLLLASDRRTDAILLNALMEDDPHSDLIPKVVHGLLAHRVKGRWGNTQENVFILLSLERYFATYESQTPDFIARIWLGDTYAGSGQFRGRSATQVAVGIPMAYLLEETTGGAQDLILSKEGAGRLYYRLGLRYAPTDLNPPPVEMGFALQRAYAGVDNPADVYKDAEGRWRVRAGARVRVTITMAADSRRYHVALTDPLPAGFEIINPALAVSGSLPQDPATQTYGWWWGGAWYEHQNLRDHRAEAFASLLWEGVYTYSYIARAVTPGVFIVPPAKAQEMYSPEVFGRSAGDVVIVE